MFKTENQLRFSRGTQNKG